MTEAMNMESANGGRLPRKNVVRKISKLAGLPVVNIRDGREEGNIESTLIDFDKKQAAAFLLASQPGAQRMAVEFGAISNFGNFALTLSENTTLIELETDDYLSSLASSGFLSPGVKVVPFQGDEVVGYIKDVEITTPTGVVGAITVMNDEGFTSPFQAKISVSDIHRIDGSRVILKEGRLPEFFREGPLGDPAAASGAVPLVVMESEWRKVLTERINEETAKILSSVKDDFTTDFDKYFEMRGQQSIKDEFDRLLEGKFDSVKTELAEALRSQFKQLQEDSMQESLDSLDKQNQILEAFKEQIGGHLKEQVEKLGAEMVPASHPGIPVIEKSKQLEKEFEARTESSITTLKSRLSDVLEKSVGTLKERLSSQTEVTSEAIERVSASMQAALLEFNRRLDNSIEDMKQLTSAALGETLSNLRKEFAFKMDGTQESLRNIEEIDDTVKDRKNTLIKTAGQITDEARITAAGKIAEVFRRYDVEAGYLRRDIQEQLEVIKKEIEDTLSDTRDAFIARANKLTPAGEDSVDPVSYEASLNELKSRIENIARITSDISTGELKKNIDESLGDLETFVSTLLHKRNKEITDAVNDVFDSMIGHISVRIDETFSPLEMDTRMKEIESRLQTIAGIEQKLRDEFETRLQDVKVGVSAETLQAETDRIKKSILDELDSMTSGLEDVLSESAERQLDSSGIVEKIKAEITASLEKDPSEVVSKTDISSLRTEINRLRREIDEKTTTVDLGPIEAASSDSFSGPLLDTIRRLVKKEIQASMPPAAPPPAQSEPGAALSVDEIKAQLVPEIIESIQKEGLLNVYAGTKTGKASEQNFSSPTTEDEAFDFLSGSLEKSMVGKKAGKDIFTDDDICLVKAGDAITAEIVKKARDFGKLIELSLDVQD